MDIVNNIQNLPKKFTPTFCVDSGAPRSFIGENELEPINETFGIKNITTTPSRFSFEFGDNIYRSLGTVRFISATPPSINDINIDVYIVECTTYLFVSPHLSLQERYDEIQTDVEGNEVETNEIFSVNQPACGEGLVTEYSVNNLNA